MTRYFRYTSRYSIYFRRAERGKQGLRVMDEDEGEDEEKVPPCFAVVLPPSPNIPIIISKLLFLFRKTIHFHNSGPTCFCCVRFRHWEETRAFASLALGSSCSSVPLAHRQSPLSGHCWANRPSIPRALLHNPRFSRIVFPPVITPSTRFYSTRFYSNTVLSLGRHSRPSVPHFCLAPRSEHRVGSLLRSLLVPSILPFRVNIDHS